MEEEVGGVLETRRVQVNQIQFGSFFYIGDSQGWVQQFFIHHFESLIVKK